MSSKLIAAKSEISLNKKIFSYSDFYVFLRKTLQERGYYIEEKSYTHSETSPLKNVSFYWNTVKNVDDFTKYIIELKVSLSLEDVTVIKDKKKEMNSRGEGSITVRATLQTDYEGKWEETNAIISFIKVLFENIFQKGSIDEHSKRLADEAYEIENEIKSYFSMQRMI
ncbi:MAG: hypothetical protein PHT91_04105 [Candidatus Nanoarchaeia archaeon]|nr:hypothetical protein [Candidatus Nanoarchaeia archaeon]MDD5053870.1 hypothetical protein [Candidatus Nanoarchaeia archaeon]MDD5500028.1 hypothetical protein [Candidatus Nanoarchaeia archaeon]